MAVTDVECLTEFLVQPRRVARRGNPHARHDAEHRQFPHAVVAGPPVDQQLGGGPISVATQNLTSN